MSNFPNPAHAKNLIRAAQALKRRKHLITLLPDQFTVFDAASAWGIKVEAANHQVRLMAKRNEIKATSEYKKPRLYRKLLDEEIQNGL
jgi:hypothetical protein